MCDRCDHQKFVNIDCSVEYNSKFSILFNQNNYLRARIINYLYKHTLSCGKATCFNCPSIFDTSSMRSLTTCDKFASASMTSLQWTDFIPFF